MLAKQGWRDKDTSPPVKLADATSKGNLKQTNETKDHHDYA
jgi:hypothetical protein